MSKIAQRVWICLPIVASIATQCGESPRGANPTRIMTVVFRLDSQPAPEVPPEQQIDFETCLVRMSFETNLVPNWRNGERVTLTETAPNVFAMQFDDVPIEIANTMGVRDVNECRRNPGGNGSVITGVTINGTPIERRVPNTRVLTFVIEADGTVLSPPLETAPR